MYVIEWFWETLQCRLVCKYLKRYSLGGPHLWVTPLLKGHTCPLSFCASLPIATIRLMLPLCQMVYSAVDIISYDPCDIILEGRKYLSHFSDEEMMLSRVKWFTPKSYSWWEADPGFKPGPAALALIIIFSLESHSLAAEEGNRKNFYFTALPAKELISYLTPDNMVINNVIRCNLQALMPEGFWSQGPW